MCIQELDFGYKSVSLDSRMLLPLSLRQYWYGAIPKCYTLLDMQPLDAAGIITLQNYPTLQLMGEGIMIGFLDTGIDYTHPVFRNLDGTTRIAGIWDQTIQDGDPPEMGMEHLLQVWLPEVQKAVDSFLGLPRRR